MKKFILASKSPRRRELLENIKIDFEIIESTTDESIIDKTLSTDLYVRELALLKATDVAGRFKGEDVYVIGADTVVAIDDEILGKPSDNDDAVNMFKKLSGREHYVYTGICVVHAKTMEACSAYEKTDVKFCDITDEDINKYLSKDSVLDKAGAYGIQGVAGVFVEKINGDYFNIVGLPVHKLSILLKNEFKINILD